MQSDLYVGQEAECKRFRSRLLDHPNRRAMEDAPSRVRQVEQRYKRFATMVPRNGSESTSIFFDDPDMENLTDSTRPGSSFRPGAPKKTVGTMAKKITTKVHVSVDGLGNPLEAIG